MRFSDNNSLLNYPNIIIADTGEICDPTAWHERMINTKIYGVEDTITAAN